MTMQVSRTRIAWGMFCALFWATWGCSVEKIDPTQTLSDAASSVNTASSSAFDDDDKPVVAYVTNGIDPFWTVAQAGCNAAAKEFNCEVLVRMPPDGAGDQNGCSRN